MVGGKIKGARNCGYAQMEDLGCALVYARLHDLACVVYEMLLIEKYRPIRAKVFT